MTLRKFGLLFTSTSGHTGLGTERERQRERERERQRDRECSATNVFNCEKVFPSRRIPA